MTINKKGIFMQESIDLTPSPRVLRMLGEIDFKAWQCLCEIIDNSIDSFANSAYITQPDEKPRVKVRLPGSSQNNISPSDALVIEDNGAGMSYDQLSKSLKAGFSANSPIDKMGLFGMGFNISTARLGNRTEVVTSTEGSDEFLRVTIDFQELEDNGHFNAPVERIPKKADEMHLHGTTVRITKLRTDHVKPLYRRKTITEKLGKIYGRIIREKDIKLSYGGAACKPFKHCHWSDERNGQTRDGAVPAVISIDKLIDEKKYCSTCWVWLSDFDSDCPSCNDSSAVIKRERRVKGWIGVQRYFHADHYGIDLIRNGRVITELDKSLFYWLNKEQDTELEYPIDGHQRLGRLVGELEIDFVKVTHQKDAFDQNTQDWRDVVLLVRGDGPIRPNIAKNLGYAPNTSPLARLFSAFRTAKAGVKNLVPQRRNGQAMITDSHIDDLIRRFYEGESDYQGDEKWWDLVNEASSSEDVTTSPDDPTGGDPFAPEIKEPEAPYDNDASQLPVDNQEPASELKTEPDTYLSQNYSLDLFKNVSIRVVADKVLEGSHENGFKVELKGVELNFTYWPNSAVFENSLLKPTDFLINELAYHMHTIAQNELSRIPISAVELALREKYFSDLYPTVDELHRQIRVFQEDLVDHLKSKIGDFKFDVSVLEEAEVASIKRKLAQNESLNDQQAADAIARGEFMSYASFSGLKTLIYVYPELVFDGNFFQQKWPAVESIGPATEILRAEFKSLIADVEWFSDNYSTSGGALWKARVKRLVGSLEILLNWRA